MSKKCIDLQQDYVENCYIHLLSFTDISGYIAFTFFKNSSNTLFSYIRHRFNLVTCKYWQCLKISLLFVDLCILFENLFLLVNRLWHPGDDIWECVASQSDTDVLTVGSVPCIAWRRMKHLFATYSMDRSMYFSLWCASSCRYKFFTFRDLFA